MLSFLSAQNLEVEHPRARLSGRKMAPCDLLDFSYNLNVVHQRRGKVARVLRFAKRVTL
jgi:hypothetical protein